MSEADERVLPDVTADERAEGWGEAPAEPADDDERLRRDVPPHHVDRD